MVTGHIRLRGNDDVEFNRRALADFNFDASFPDVFHVEPAPRYGAPSIFLGGTFKEIEQDWRAWLSRLAGLLSTLEAVEATVTLDGWRGRFTWVLQPDVVARGEAWPASLVGQRWVLIEWPQDEADLTVEDGSDAPDELERLADRP
ncbi:hypothetical protein [Deinococcus pimensis]|uniref:hypothetical protein n=1 Tax=Deinococcus pimensis TaxID=309888 RepID=UPI0004ACCA67|nr:hypothetical protein [Deinococcus pimensis]